MSRERLKSSPSIPPAQVLHKEYIRRRNTEIAEGRYTPGKLLPLQLEQSSLRQIFTDQGRRTAEGTPIDWYNPTQPFDDCGDRIMAVRFEPRNSELSFVGFIKKDPQNGEYSFDWTRPIIDMAQDPSITFDNNGHPVLGVVKIDAKDGVITNYYTEQFRGSDVRNLTSFQTICGKDNRPVQGVDGVLAFYRPQGEVGGAGKIAARRYFDWESYKNDANLRPIKDEDLLVTNFQDDNHGGPNFPLPNGEVYGHIAYKQRDENGNVIRLHYYATWMLTDSKSGQIFCQEDPKTGLLKPLVRIIADRLDFPPAPHKRLLTKDVVFTSGVEETPHGKILTLGIGDAQIGVKKIEDPMRSIDRSTLRLAA